MIRMISHANCYQLFCEMIDGVVVFRELERSRVVHQAVESGALAGQHFDHHGDGHSTKK